MASELNIIGCYAVVENDQGIKEVKAADNCRPKGHGASIRLQNPIIITDETPGRSQSISYEVKDVDETAFTNFITSFGQLLNFCDVTFHCINNELVSFKKDCVNASIKAYGRHFIITTDRFLEFMGGKVITKITIDPFKTSFWAKNTAITDADWNKLNGNHIINTLNALFNFNIEKEDVLKAMKSRSQFQKHASHEKIPVNHAQVHLDRLLDLARISRYVMLDTVFLSRKSNPTFDPVVQKDETIQVSNLDNNVSFGVLPDMLHEVFIGESDQPKVDKSKVKVVVFETTPSNQWNVFYVRHMLDAKLDPNNVKTFENVNVPTGTTDGRTQIFEAKSFTMEQAEEGFNACMRDWIGINNSGFPRYIEPSLGKYISYVNAKTGNDLLQAFDSQISIKRNVLHFYYPVYVWANGRNRMKTALGQMLNNFLGSWVTPLEQDAFREKKEDLKKQETLFSPSIRIKDFHEHEIRSRLFSEYFVEVYHVDRRLYLQLKKVKTNTAGGGTKKLHILGRNRVVRKVGRKSMITYQGQQITLSQARLIERSKSKKRFNSGTSDKKISRKKV